MVKYRNADFLSQSGKLLSVIGKLKELSVFYKMDTICIDQVKLQFGFSV